MPSVSTIWETEEIWVRREFSLPENLKDGKLFLSYGYDDDFQLYLNGKKLVTTSNTKELLLPLDVQEGRNIILIAGVAGYRGSNTGLYIKVVHNGLPIGTGPWWEITSRRQLFGSKGSPGESLDPKEWIPASIENKMENDYTGDRYLDWIKLPRRQPFFLRLDFEVKHGRILTDHINIRGGNKFDFYVNGQLFGSGQKTYWDRTHSFIFPQLKDKLYDIGIAVEAEPDEITRSFNLGSSSARVRAPRSVNNR